jgi:hypothetical protein
MQSNKASTKTSTETNHLSNNLPHSLTHAGARQTVMVALAAVAILALAAPAC